jgi:hypothetical protein
MSTPKIDLKSRKKFLHEATRLAIESVEKGWGGPFGAVIVKDGEIIGRGQNRVLLQKSPQLSTPVVESTPRRCWVPIIMRET